jgi:hypothetical protein
MRPVSIAMQIVITRHTPAPASQVGDQRERLGGHPKPANPRAGRWGWTLSRIQDATGIRRETISTVVQT